MRTVFVAWLTDTWDSRMTSSTHRKILGYLCLSQIVRFFSSYFRSFYWLFPCQCFKVSNLYHLAFIFIFLFKICLIYYLSLHLFVLFFFSLFPPPTFSFPPFFLSLKFVIQVRVTSLCREVCGTEWDRIMFEDLSAWHKAEKKKIPFSLSFQ